MTTAGLPVRVVRGLVLGVAIAALMLLVAGRLDLVLLDAYVAIIGLMMLTGMVAADPDLARERLRPGQVGEDPVRLVLLRVLFSAHLVIGLLDVGRFHWSDTMPTGLRLFGLALLAATMAWTLWAVASNRFFVPVIRIQTERGHQVVDRGPYALVRHPGYAGMTLVPPASALALGSWWSLVPALVLPLLFLRRAAHEDRFLREQLPGYAQYSERVRWRLVPGVW